MIQASHFSSDIQEFLRLLSVNKVRYVIIGGEAVIYYGYARLTGDVDIFYEISSENAKNLYNVLRTFWEGKIPGLKSAEELLTPGMILQFGVPPNRIDLINSIDAVPFEEAWESRIEEEMEIKGKKHPVYYIGLKQLIKNKKAIKRYRDLDDLKYLIEVLKSRE